MIVTYHLLNYGILIYIYLFIKINTLPTALSIFCIILVLNMNIYFIGNLNKPVLLAAVGFASTYINVFGIFVILALNIGLLTMSS
jgi:hypothetical protein